MSDTIYKLGTQELAYCKFTWPVYRGVFPRIVSIIQPRESSEKFKALPYINDFYVSHSYGVGASPPEGAVTFPGVCLLEVRDLNEDTCELLLSDCRIDLAKLVNPVAANLRFNDGYLDSTAFKTLQDFLAYWQRTDARFAALLSPDALGIASSIDARMADGLPIGGLMAPHALQRVLEDLGVDLTVGRDGLLTIATRADIEEANALPNPAAYLWLKGGSPSWATLKRKQNGLPRKIRVHYRERHAIRIALSARLQGSAVGRNVLLMGLEQVYAAGGKYLTLNELLEAYGFTSGDISDAAIAASIMSKNFEGTRIERLNGQATDADTETVIFTIKRDWRRLWRLVFMDSAGRRGTWTDKQFGKFALDLDLDGSFEPSGKMDASALESKWAEFLNVVAEVNTNSQGSLVGARVATTHTKAPAGQSLPSAPFAVGWEPGGEADGIIRFTQQVLPDNNEAMPGELDTLDGSGNISVGFTSNGVAKKDDGSGIPTDWNLGWPAKESAIFKPALELYIYLVAERQLPNTEERWTTFEHDGFADGDVEYADLEVGPELMALYDYVDERQSKFPERDPALGLGELLNPEALEADRKRRVARHKKLLTQQAAATGRSLGCVLAGDVQCSGAVSELRIEIDGVNVSTVIEAGALGDPDAQERNAQRRAPARVVASGGKVAI